MTKEEAIVDIRDNIKPVVGGKSLDMAIEALEQEPCDNVLTLTERVITQVTEDMDNFIFTTIKPWCEEKEQRIISKRDLEQALTQYFNKEPKTGHWIVWNTDSYDWTYKCDKCERIALKDSNYCPNCGARMESEARNE